MSDPVNEVTGRAVNGSRVQITLPDFEGEAGVTRLGALVQIGYRPNRSGSRLEVGKLVQIGADNYRVTKAGRSEFAPAVTVLDLEVVS